jgi:hypothetical protein
LLFQAASLDVGALDVDALDATAVVAATPDGTASVGAAPIVLDDCRLKIGDWIWVDLQQC